MNKNIQSYSAINKMELFLPDHSGMRLWKMQLPNGKFISLTISTKTRLRKVLLKYNPRNVWFTRSLFRNVKNIEKFDRKKRRKLILKQDLVFDLDDVEISKVKILLNLMKPQKPKYIIQTSLQSFQINYGNVKISENPLASFFRYQEIKERCKIDECVNMDVFRVVRAPFTINNNHKKPFLVKFINIEDIPNSSEMIPEGEDDQGTCPVSSCINVIKRKAILTKPSFYSYGCVKTRIGHNKWFLFVSVPKRRFNYRFRAFCKRIMKKYNLNTLYFINYGNFIGITSGTILDKRRLEKINKAFNYKIRMDRPLKMRITPIVYDEFYSISKPGPFGKIKNKSSAPVSRAHNSLMKFIGFDIRTKELSDPEIIKIVETRRNKLNENKTIM